jgi:hypothetical protein
MRALRLRRENKREKLQFLLSLRAAALPVSFLMLFVSLTLIVSATYYVSVTKIQAKGKLLNFTVSKQNMQSFENAIEFIKWSPGSSSVYNFDDSGGIFRIYPTARSLLINITDNNTFDSSVFNNSIGKAVYQLPSADTATYTFYMKGDRRAIINESIHTMTQLYLSAGEIAPELTLTYRPLATVLETGVSQGKPQNLLRIYIINLNESSELVANGQASIKAKCISVTPALQTYNLSNPTDTLFVRAILDERSDQVEFRIASNANGTIIDVEILVCNIALERIQGDV